jgi:hypothetical protein
MFSIAPERRPSSGCRHLLPVSTGRSFLSGDFANLVTLTASEIINEIKLLPVVHGEKVPAGG